MSQATPTHVYILGFSDRVIKVGRSSNVRKRIAAHASAAAIRKATVTNEWTLRTDEAERAESLLRVLARAHLHRLAGAEWFEGNYRRFVRAAERSFKYHQLIPVEGVTREEALELVDGNKRLLRVGEEMGTLRYVRTDEGPVLMPWSVKRWMGELRYLGWLPQ